MSYEREWADENKQRNRGSMNILMDMDSNLNYETSRPNSRVGVNVTARDILDKNRGGTGFLFGPDRRGYSPRPGSRMQGNEAADIHQKGVNGTMGSVLNLNNTSGYSTSRPAVRVKPEAEENALRNSGTMNMILNSEKNKGYATARGASRGVKPEAEDNAIKNNGTMNLVLDQGKNRAHSSARPQGRSVKPEAESIATMNKGTMNLVLSSNNKPNDQPQLRVKAEAFDSYNKNRGSLTQIYGNYGNAPASSRPDPKVKGEGQEIQQHGQKGTLCFLLTKYGNLPSDSKQASRVKPEARKAAKKGQGSIGDLLGTQGKHNKKYRS